MLTLPRGLHHLAPGPILRKELRAATRGRGPFALRTVLGLALGAALAMVGLVTLGVGSGDDLPPPNERLEAFGSLSLLVTTAVQLVILLFLVPSSVGGAVAGERESDTLWMLVLTRLTPAEILLYKLAARLVRPLGLVLVLWPLAAWPAWAAGLLPEAMLALAMVLSTAVLIGAICIMRSAYANCTAMAQAGGGFLAFLLLVVPPVIARISSSPGTALGYAAAGARAVAAPVARVSPLSLVTDPSWLTSPGAASLAARVGLMIGLQLAIAAAAIFHATEGVELLEPGESPSRSHRECRPVCGPDPIYWREFELPFRRASPNRIVLYLRRLLEIVRILKSLFSQLLLWLVEAIPAALLTATVWLAILALQELWQNGFDPAGPYLWRSRYNWLVVGATCALGFPFLINSISRGIQAVVDERNQKTWDSLLATPLDGPEILGAKARAIAASFWSFARWLVPIWGVGIACGAVHPLGAALAAIDLPLAVWVGLALGLSVGVRERERLPGEGNPGVMLAMVASAFVHMSLLRACLSTLPNVALFFTWDVRHRAAILLALVAIPALSALAARSLTRHTYDRFDEWVGRPRRPVRGPDDQASRAEEETRGGTERRSPGEERPLALNPPVPRAPAP